MHRLKALILNIEYWMLDIEYWMLDIGCWMLDSSLEFSDHERIAESLGLTVCFTGSHTLWKRGIDDGLSPAEFEKNYFEKQLSV